MKMSDPGTDLQIKAIVSVMGMASRTGAVGISVSLAQSLQVSCLEVALLACSTSGFHILTLDMPRLIPDCQLCTVFMKAS